jgi:hypothetical protein
VLSRNTVRVVEVARDKSKFNKVVLNKTGYLILDIVSIYKIQLFYLEFQ